MPRILRIAPALLLWGLLAACGSAHLWQRPVGYVDLNDLQPLPTPVNTEVTALKVAIAAVISPQGTVESYQPLLGVLQTALSRPIERVQRRTYEEVDRMLAQGEVDVGFVCTSSYLNLRDEGVDLLVAPMVNGQTVYHAQVIVAADSPYQTFDDLQGAVFAFTDPRSFTGSVYPRYLLHQRGTTPEAFFQRTFFTYSHDAAIQAVAEGVADAASVDSLVLAFALQRDPTLGERIRVIHTSPPFGIPPVVVSPAVRPQTRALLAETLLNLHTTPMGRAALNVLGYDRFVEVSPDLYDSAAEVQQAVEGQP